MLYEGSGWHGRTVFLKSVTGFTLFFNVMRCTHIFVKFNAKCSQCEGFTFEVELQP